MTQPTIPSSDTSIPSFLQQVIKDAQLLINKCAELENNNETEAPAVSDNEPETNPK